MSCIHRRSISSPKEQVGGACVRGNGVCVRYVRVVRVVMRCAMLCRVFCFVIFFRLALVSARAVCVTRHVCAILCTQKAIN